MIILVFSSLCDFVMKAAAPCCFSHFKSFMHCSSLPYGQRTFLRLTLAAWGFFLRQVHFVPKLCWGLALGRIFKVAFGPPINTFRGKQASGSPRGLEICFSPRVGWVVRKGLPRLGRWSRPRHIGMVSRSVHLHAKKTALEWHCAFLRKGVV